MSMMAAMASGVREQASATVVPRTVGVGRAHTPVSSWPEALGFSVTLSMSSMGPVSIVRTRLGRLRGGR